MHFKQKFYCLVYYGRRACVGNEITAFAKRKTSGQLQTPSGANLILHVGSEFPLCPGLQSSSC